MSINLSQFPQITLVPQPTRVYPLEKLSRHLGASVYIKRDDTDFLGGGGNKLRKLEFLLGDAMQKGCDTIITVGAWQSNHARLTAAACNYLGLKCELVLGKTVARSDSDYRMNGNYLLDTILDVERYTPEEGVDLIEFADNLQTQLVNKGKKPYVIPFGGSNPIGALGYVKCAQEIKQQEQQLGVSFDKIVLVNGSHGTQAGMIAGAKLVNLKAEIHGYNVVRNREKAFSLTKNLAQETLDLVKPHEIQLTNADILMDDSFLGSAYGQPTDAAIAAIQLLAKTEGLFLDPVYTSKAFAGLIHAIQTGVFHTNETILFLMTGGTPALYAYRNLFSPGA